MTPDPFFSNYLDNFEPKRPDFEHEIDPDFDDEICPVCCIKFGEHSVKQTIECALMEIRYPQGGESH